FVENSPRNARPDKVSGKVSDKDLVFRRGSIYLLMHPEGIQLGRFQVGWYAVMLGLGFVLGWFTARRRTRQAGIPEPWLADVFLLTLLAAIAASRVWHIAENWPKF